MLKEEFNCIVDRLRQAAVNFYGDRLVSLAVYGSVASESMRPDSDIDFLICARELPRGRRNRLKEFQALEKTLAPLLRELKTKNLFPFLSPVIKTPEEVKEGSLIFIDMTENVKILYDNNSFFQNYLEGLKKQLKKLGSKKIQIGGAWYWDLVPNFKLIKEVSL